MGFSLSKNIDKFRLEFGDPGNFLKAWYLNFKIEILLDTKNFYVLLLHSNLDIVNKSVRSFLFTISNNLLYQIKYA